MFNFNLDCLITYDWSQKFIWTFYVLLKAGSLGAKLQASCDEKLAIKIFLGYCFQKYVDLINILDKTNKKL